MGASHRPHLSAPQAGLSVDFFAKHPNSAGIKRTIAGLSGDMAYYCSYLEITFTQRSPTPPMDAVGFSIRDGPDSNLANTGFSIRPPDSHPAEARIRIPRPVSHPAPGPDSHPAPRPDLHPAPGPTLGSTAPGPGPVAGRGGVLGGGESVEEVGG